MVTLLGAFWGYYWNNIVYIYINYMIYIYIYLIYHSASMILLLIRFVWFFIHFSGSQAKNNQAPGSAGQGSWERACEEAVESWPRAQTMRCSISPDFTGYHCHSSVQCHSSGKHTKNYGKSPFLMGKSTISMAMFNSFLYVYQRVQYPMERIPCKNGKLILSLGFQGSFQVWWS